jgi:hypothetical protein
MRTTTLSVRRCLQCNFQRPRRHTSGSSNSHKKVPLRIFSTGDDTADIRLTTRHTSEAAQAKREKRYQEWVKEQLARTPSVERLRNDFSKRLGELLPRGLLEASRYTRMQTGPRLRNRVRVGSVLENPQKVTPEELLQSPEKVETKETIIEAIETCIFAAVKRLELFDSNGDVSIPTKDRKSVPHDQYLWLHNILQFQFSKVQLIDYGHSRGLIKTKLRREQTTDVINTILDRVWNLEKEPELAPEEGLVTKSKRF